MYQILTPIDDSTDRAERQAAHIAGLPCAAEEIAVTLTHVLHGAEKEAPEGMANPGRVLSVRTARDILEDAGVDVSIAETTPPPADGIVELADEVDADLIVLGGRRRSPAGKVLFGSVTQSVLLRTDRPVTVSGTRE